MLTTKKKLYVRWSQAKRRVVSSNTVVKPLSAGLPQIKRLTNRETIILVTREMFIWTYDVVFVCFGFFCTVFFLHYLKVNRCILKAQQIQNIIKEYDNITQKTQTNGGILILYMKWDLQATPNLLTVPIILILISVDRYLCSPLSGAPFLSKK